MKHKPEYLTTPPDRSWTVAIMAVGNSLPVGSGTLIDSTRVLTSRHVVAGWDPRAISVGFLALDNPYHEPVAVAEVHLSTHEDADAAILVLSERAPDGAAPARLRRIPGRSLIGDAWWAYGYHDRIGDSAYGVVSESLSLGLVLLETDSDCRSEVVEGFSGSGVWSPQANAVVAVVVQSNAGQGRALLIQNAAQVLPDDELAELANTFRLDDAGVDAAAEWGWRLSLDEEGRRHWRPRARGVSSDAEQGWRFKGRELALTEIADWLAAAEVVRTPLVVTGSPGVGKSALLARIVTTADPEVAAELPKDDVAVRAPLHSVACAVHAKGKTALDVAREIARAASAELPDSVSDTVIVVRKALTEVPGRRRFSVLLDALDEASTPLEARLIATDILRPLAEDCGDLGLRVLVGTRRRDDAGDLIGNLGYARREIDLDLRKYIGHDDLADYALATLRLDGSPRKDGPYSDEAAAMPVAVRIAEISDSNFLVAGLLARKHGLYDTVPPDPASIQLIDDHDHLALALSGYLHRMGGIGGLTATQLFLPLAYSETPGLTAELWAAAVNALNGCAIGPAALLQFASGSAANFLIQTSSENASYRLFHQALAETLTRGRPTAKDEAVLTDAFIAYGDGRSWDDVPDYLLRSLPHHAQRGERIDAALCNLPFVLRADLTKLIPAGRYAVSASAREIANLIRRTPHAINLRREDRLAAFTLTDAMDDLATGVSQLEIPVRYRALWAQTRPAYDLVTLTGHSGKVNGICPVRVDGRELIASAGSDATIRLWDPDDGRNVRYLVGHTRRVNSVCTIAVDGRELLASAGSDGTIRLWDPGEGRLIRNLIGHVGRVNAICAITLDGAHFLASAGSDRTVRVWDPTKVDAVRTLTGTGRVTGVCEIAVNRRQLVASAQSEGTVRLWDPTDGHTIRQLAGHDGRVNSVCTIELLGQTMLVSASKGTVRVWNPNDGRILRRLTGHTGEVNGVCALTVNGQQLVASAGNDRDLRLWDPSDGREVRRLTGHTGRVIAVCPVTVNGQQLLASSGDDGTVRLWDPGDIHTVGNPAVHTGRVNAVCVLTAKGLDLVASAGSDHSVRLWNTRDGRAVRQMASPSGRVNALCPIAVNGQQLVASAGEDRAVRIWDPNDGRMLTRLTGQVGKVNALCTFGEDSGLLLAAAESSGTVRLWDPRDGRMVGQLSGHVGRVNAISRVRVDNEVFLASAGDDHTVRVWDPRAGRSVRLLSGHSSWINALCTIEIDGRELLASAGDDRTIRLWNPQEGRVVRRLEGHTGWVNSVCSFEVDGKQLLASAGNDRTVRLWDITRAVPELVVELRDVALALAPCGSSRLVIALDTGVLALKFAS